MTDTIGSNGNEKTESISITSYSSITIESIVLVKFLSTCVILEMKETYLLRYLFSQNLSKLFCRQIYHLYVLNGLIRSFVFVWKTSFSNKVCYYSYLHRLCRFRYCHNNFKMCVVFILFTWFLALLYFIHSHSFLALIGVLRDWSLILFSFFRNTELSNNW